MSQLPSNLSQVSEELSTTKAWSASDQHAHSQAVATACQNVFRPLTGSDADPGRKPSSIARKKRLGLVGHGRSATFPTASPSKTTTTRAKRRGGKQKCCPCCERPWTVETLLSYMDRAETMESQYWHDTSSDSSTEEPASSSEDGSETSIML